MPEEVARQKFYSAVIPAWNEEKTIGEAIGAFKAHPLCSEVIVVSDGSTDRTAETARSFGATVLVLEKNVGKAEAMDMGVAKASTDVIFFSDGDIFGLNSDIISAMSEPVLSGDCPMYIALRGRNIYWMNRILHFFPLLGGQRVITKDLWYSVPKIYRKGFQIEIALNYYTRKLGHKARFRLFMEIKHVKKELKYGFWLGFWMRVKMYLEVFLISVRLYVFENISELFSPAPAAIKVSVEETK